MGEAAKAFWVDEDEMPEPEPVIEYEDISFICTGIDDNCWKFGSD
jgi:hypothetical protein